jgi:hypothetical protein
MMVCYVFQLRGQGEDAQELERLSGACVHRPDGREGRVVPLLRHRDVVLGKQLAHPSPGHSAAAATAASAVAAAVQGIADPAAAAAPQEPTDPGNNGLDERLASAGQHGRGGAMRQAILPRPVPPRLRLPLLLLVSEQLVLRIPELQMMHAYRQFNQPDEEKDSMGTCRSFWILSLSATEERTKKLSSSGSTTSVSSSRKK